MTIVKAHDASLRGVEHVLGHWTHEKSLPKALSSTNTLRRIYNGQKKPPVQV